MSWTNEDVRDEIYEQDEEEDEGPSWVDDKGKILEAAFCEYFLAKHPLMCLKQILFDLDGEVDEDKLIYEIHQEIRYYARAEISGRAADFRGYFDFAGIYRLPSHPFHQSTEDADLDRQGRRR